MSVPEYNYSEIEKKWQKIWADEKAFCASDSFDKPKYYCLIEFPYPSGAGLHVGHPRSNTALDIISRKRRMERYNVLYPIGWDAFGLPTENYAIDNNIHPSIVTEKNINHFREQLQRIGFSFDYSREVNTTDPKYYKWTQWIFLKLFENGLAYKDKININYCPSCKVGLANEEVVDGECERCHNKVVRRTKEQWMLKITDYAQKLLDGLDDIDFIERVKIQQRNWIGRSEGAEVDFAIANKDYKLRVFTTRPDTLFGATYMVISPEHPILDEFSSDIKNIDEVIKYREITALKSDMERTELNKDKSGVELKGIKAINPVNDHEIPIFVSDYVLMSYGTGAIMAVPGHDTRDYEFAKKFNLPIIEVVSGGNIEEEAYTDSENGVLINSGLLNGLKVPDAKKKIIQFLTDKNAGEKTINYKLRDWVFSRQRYWGEPIPLVKCDTCGWVPLPYNQLPLTLPEVDEFKPGEGGESPLANVTDWVNTTCPKCGKPATRETDTMPQWAGSSWYFLRYIDPHNDDELAAKENLNYWLPVDWYNGGMEHTTLHLLYSRFWHKFLYDIGVVTSPEPYQKRTSHGMILGENGEKMSKSRGNVVNPDDMVDEYGADAFRMYEMFMGAFDQPIPWSTHGVKGCKRFLDRVWRLQESIEGEEIRPDMESLTHKMIKKVSQDYEAMKYNTAIATMMSYVNDVYAKETISKREYLTLITLLNPVAPHITEEIYHNLGGEGLLSLSEWPKWDESKCEDAVKEIAVQVNGKLRGTIVIPADADEKAIEGLALDQENVKNYIEGKTIVKIIVIKGRIVNIVVK
ncbi:MAG: leucine--tRNA ligase [Clostridia bacterium]|nr:leucine--tRNA ligase [Clostridia bacterium]